MAGPEDLELPAGYEPLVQALARAGLTRRTDATRAVEAVVCALALRTRGDAWDRMRELLPDPFRDRLLPCERHAGARNSPRNLEEMEEIVGEDLGRPAEATEPVIRAVLAALRAQLGEAHAEELGNRLPAELEPLWRRPS